MNLLNLLHEIYCLSVNFLLAVVLRPVLKLCERFASVLQYERFNYYLIGVTNYLFPLYLLKSKRTNKVKYDIRQFRDTYDKEGAKLYTQNFVPEYLFRDKKVLDFGCGVGGKDLELLKYAPKRIVGIDLSERNIKYATELISSENYDRLSYVCRDIFDEKELFDVIISFTVFEHVERGLLHKILEQMYRLLNNGGCVIIVFNHFNDKFGTHTSEYVFNPWPQLVFEESMIYSFWNKKLQEDPLINDNSYFPPEYKHGVLGHNNSDCFMNLNKVTIKEFEEIISRTRFRYERKLLYRKSPLLQIFPFLPKKYLEGSAVYFLRKT